MLRHEDIWRAIDAFAAERNLTPSGLARRSGLDPTTFNKSKRFTREGKPRWPSTESIAKILKAFGAEIRDFARHLPYGTGPALHTPLIGTAQAGAAGAFDEKGNPNVEKWERASLPDIGDPDAFALRVVGTCMKPLYRDGDIILISPRTKAEPGNRVVVCTKSGEIVAKEFVKRDESFTELRPLNPEESDRILANDEILWIGRIVWAQQ